MKGPTHILGAVSVGAVLANYFDTPFSSLPWVVIVISSILPDIDEPSSTISNPSKFIKKGIPRPILEFLDLVVWIIALPIRLFTSHRGVTHSLLITLLLSGLIFNICKSYLIWFFLGYFSHLFLDFLTPMGIPIFWPISDKKFSLKLIKTGSIPEFFLAAFFGVILVLACLNELHIWGV